MLNERLSASGRPTRSLWLIVTQAPNIALQNLTTLISDLFSMKLAYAAKYFTGAHTSALLMLITPNVRRYRRIAHIWHDLCISVLSRDRWSPLSESEELVV